MPVGNSGHRRQVNVIDLLFSKREGERESVTSLPREILSAVASRLIQKETQLSTTNKIPGAYTSIINEPIRRLK